jgi:DNA modification methylase
MAKPRATKLQVQYLKIADLKPYSKNARTHSPAQVTQIAKSITAFGFTNPILIDGKNGLIAGHGRLLAASQLGMAEVPTIALVGLSEAEKRALIIADNKLAMNAGWDDDMLRLELADLTALGADLDLLGFTDAELANLMGDRGGKTDPDAVPMPVDEPVVQLGDLWHLGQHRLLIGDSTDADAVDRLLAGAKPHLMVTDPPYGVNYDPTWRQRAGVSKNKAKMGKVTNDDRADWTPAWALFPGDVAYVWHGGLHSSTVEASLKDAGLAVRSQIIWNKDRFALGRGDYHWRHEPAWYAVREGKKGSWAGDRKQDTVWNIPAREDGGHGHGTQKPIECMRRPIVNNSKAGDAVYDPFLGSGTTLIAAQMEARVCYGLEISPQYGQVIIERWQAFTGEVALLDGKTPFSAIVSPKKRRKS